jgi:hypothetical protein
MGVLWLKAPFVLRHHSAVLGAVVLLSALVALAVASPPLVRAGVASESLQQRLRDFSPLAAGLEVNVAAAPTAEDASRRAAAVRFAASSRDLGRPVVASLFDASVAGGVADVVVLARTGALEHVHRERQARSGEGVWIADTTAQATHLEPGDVLPLTELGFGRKPTLKLRVAGVYRALTAVDAGTAYWANWVQDIRSPNLDATPPPPFVLVSASTFERVAKKLSPTTENRFEFPVDPSGITLTGAKRLLGRFDRLSAELHSPAGVPLGCGPRSSCSTDSLLQSALTLTARDVAGVAPTISLLADCGLVITIALCVGAGVFLVRRRRDEADMLFVRGEAALAFAARVAVEAALPALVGGAVGFGTALLAASAVTPGGAISSDVVGSASWRAAAGAGGAILAVAVGAAAAFPRRERERSRLGRVPWEVLPLAGAAVLLGVVLAGGGLVRDSTGLQHPRLAIFLVPVFAAVGVAGIALRALRGALRTRTSPRRPALLLVLRRLGAARGLLVAVFVSTAAAAGTFAYAATLSASVSRSAAEKAYVANGSDVQGFVDPRFRVLKPFTFPVALVEVDQGNVTLPSGRSIDVIAGSGPALSRTLRGWQTDPRPLLAKLRGHAAIGSPGFPPTDAIIDQRVRIPIHIVGRTVVPGASAGRPALLVPRALLERTRLIEPAPGAIGLVWARGPSRSVERQLLSSDLQPSYLTTPGHILSDPSVAAAERSYRYVKVIAVAAAILSLVGLVLYLQARQSGQLIATALTRRMGLARSEDMIALALEAAAIVLSAAVVGCAVAAATARPIVQRLDALELYAPGPAFVVPWTVLVAGTAVGMLIAAVLGALAVAVAERSNVAEALRVA